MAWIMQACYKNLKKKKLVQILGMVTHAFIPALGKLRQEIQEFQAR